MRINEGGESRFEIHVYDKKGLAAGEDSGTVMGKDGFVTKHGKPARPPKNAPDSVLRNLNRINIGILRRQGKIKPGDPYRSGAYLNNGSSVLKGAVSKMGIITNISGIGSGLIDDYELYERAKKNGVSMAVQFQIENHKKKYISTPFGVFPNDCRTGGLCIQDPTGYE